jgi:hypothetical protein
MRRLPLCLPISPYSAITTRKGDSYPEPGMLIAKLAVDGPSTMVYGCAKLQVEGLLPAVQATRYVVWAFAVWRNGSACHCLPTRIVERKRGGETDGNGESDHGEVGNEEVCRRLGESTRDED